MTINELITTAHANAKAKGWWDQERNTGELLMLIVSECGEALEAHRSGKRAELEEFQKHEMLHGVSVNKLNFEVLIKDTFEDELADIVIRIADWMGHNGWVYVAHSAPVYTSASDNVGERLFDVVSVLVGGEYSAATDQRYCSQAIDEVAGIAGSHNIDLWRHIELKLAYNKTRPHKHGKAY